MPCRVGRYYDILPGVYTAAMHSQWGRRGNQWKDLKPELLRHAELGIAQQVSTATRLQITVFDDRVTDALRFVPPPPPPPMFANIGDYAVRGVEATLSVVASQKLGFFGGATFLDATPGDVPNSPKWSLVAGMSWAPADRLRLHADAEWVDSQTVLNPRFSASQARIGSYFLLNAKASYRLKLLSSLASELFVAGENLTGSDYEYRPGYPAPGRTVSCGLDLRF